MHLQIFPQQGRIGGCEERRFVAFDAFLPGYLGTGYKDP